MKDLFNDPHFIEFEGKFYKCSNLQELLTFIKFEDAFIEIVQKSIKKLKRAKNFSKLMPEKFLKEIGVSYPHSVRGCFISVDRLLFQSILTGIEKICGDILLKKSPTYSDIIEMQYTFKIMKDFYVDRGLPNFTAEQKRQSDNLKENFNKRISDFAERL